MMMSDTYEDAYPEIEDNESNFITDYLNDASSFDIYEVFHHGSLVYKYDDDIIEDAWDNWIANIDSIMAVHLDSWARLYYALSIQYNPTFNVDGVVTMEYGNTHVENTMGETTTTDTIADRDNEATDFEKVYDSGTEKQTAHTESTIGGGIDTTVTDEHTNTVEADKHTDTETRKGNIGVTMTQQMLEAEYSFRKKSFFREILETIMMESGCDYE